MADEIHTGGGGAVSGDVRAGGDFTGRDKPTQLINFTAPESLVQQLVFVLTDLKLDVRGLSDDFKRQSQQIQDMKIDINALKVDMVGVKQQMHAMERAMEVRRNQSEEQGREIKSLKTQMEKVSHDVITQAHAVNASLSRRSQIELRVLIGVLLALGIAFVLGQMQWW